MLKEIPELVDSYGRISFWYNEMKVCQKTDNWADHKQACSEWQKAQDHHAKVCKKYKYKMYFDIK